MYICHREVISSAALQSASLNDIVEPEQLAMIIKTLNFSSLKRNKRQPPQTPLADARATSPLRLPLLAIHGREARIRGDARGQEGP